MKLTTKEELGAALEIVYGLAEENVLTEEQAAKNEAEDDRAEQLAALATVHDFIVNYFEEDEKPPAAT